VTDGGVVSDEAAQIRVPQSSTAAAFFALSLAADRFGARPLVVKGSDAFRHQLASLAGIEGLSVTFADPALERQRAQSRAAVTRGVYPRRDRADQGQGFGRADTGGDRGR
jgi:hypothetical protein